MLLVVEVLIPCVGGAGQCFRECWGMGRWGVRVSLAMWTRAEVCMGIGRVRQKRN